MSSFIQALHVWDIMKELKDSTDSLESSESTGKSSRRASLELNNANKAKMGTLSLP